MMRYPTRHLAALVTFVLLLAGCTSSDTSDARHERPSTAEDQPAPHDHDHSHEGHHHAAAPGDPHDWCGGHGLPESMCTKCNPELIEKFKAAGDWCDEHGFPESACPKCNPIAAPPARVVLATAGHELQAGITTAPVRGTHAHRAERVPARILYDQNRVADVRSPQPGILRAVHVEPGAHVERGQPLFELESAQVGQLQAELGGAREALAAARSNLARQQRLRASGLVGERAVEIARQELEAATSRLQTIESSLRLSGATSGRATGRYTVRAPIGGTVVRRPALVGTLATEATSLATIADLNTMWARLDVPDRLAARLTLGRPVELELESGARATGTIEAIASEVHPQTLTVQVRVTLPNTGGALRANQYAWASLPLNEAVDTIAVPRAAVQRLDGARVVFVRLEPGVFEARQVEIVAGEGEELFVRGALHAGEEVVVGGTYLVLTELRRDDIGDGCAH